MYCLIAKKCNTYKIACKKLEKFLFFCWQKIKFNVSFNRYITLRGVAQLVAHVVWDHGAGGSSPFTPTIYKI